MKMLYKYPHNKFPYDELIFNNRNRTYDDPEYELLDTGIFEEARYFDVVIEYAKADQDDILIQISATNRGPDQAAFTLLPTLWYRNTWGWGYESGPMKDTPWKPGLELKPEGSMGPVIIGHHPKVGVYYFYAEDASETIFTDNETNTERLFGEPNQSTYVKDGFHQYIIQGNTEAVNPDKNGTKAAVVYKMEIQSGGTQVIRLRLSDHSQSSAFQRFEAIFDQRRKEADEFYHAIQNSKLNLNDLNIQRQAFAGMLWTKQLYYYDVEQWLKGDPIAISTDERKEGRNHGWSHLVNFDVISMPDKWEYPWYATWDLAFHCIPLAIIDPDYAKRQLTLLTRVWYMHPNGQLPAYEWSFGDVNPPVHAWATWRVYKIDAKATGQPDLAFLESIFHTMLLNFTWWTNKKDEDGNNIFQGGFLGLDNISVFNRSEALPLDGHIDQADGTSWMAAFCLTMMRIALELAKTTPTYQDIATKFFEHFLRIAHSMTELGEDGYSLWDVDDEFFYDGLHIPGKRTIPLKIRSMVGLLPLLAVETLDHEILQELPTFYRRMCWFVDNRPHLSGNMASVYETGTGERHIFSILTKERLIKVLEKMLDENEFLSNFGIRSLSKSHKNHPFNFQAFGKTHTVSYWPAEAKSGLFGGNSNWRGPIWFPINFLIIESLQRYHHFYGDDLKVEFPTGSKRFMNLREVAEELSKRLMGLFQKDEDGLRPIYGADQTWKEYLLFHEYFHGDTGIGLGASHQTGWTGLVAKLLQQSDE